MGSHTKDHSCWLTQLAKEYPETTKQLCDLAAHLATKQQKLTALVRYCATRPELDLMRMYAEYSAALDAVAMEPPIDEIPELSNEEAAVLGPRERAGRTKRIRTKMRILNVASRLLEGAQPLAIDGLCNLAGVSEPTFYNHFRSRSQLVVAAYSHLVA